MARRASDGGASEPMDGRGLITFSRLPRRPNVQAPGGPGIGCVIGNAQPTASVAEEVINQLAARDDTVGAEQQQRQESALTCPTDLDRGSVEPHLDGAEDAKHPPPRHLARVLRQPPWGAE